MRIKKEFIGVTIKVIDKPAVTIVDLPENYPYYKSLGFDIFEEEKPKRKKKSDKADEGNDEQ